MPESQPDQLLISFETIEDICSSYMRKHDVRLVERAYHFAESAHHGQNRASGEPYIQHPLHVCLTLAKLHLDPATLAAAFMHDVAEDTKISLGEIRLRFGWRVANLVDGVTKLDQIETGRSFFRSLFQRQTEKPQPLSRSERRVESLRKMLLATSKDVRVVLIKLADRLHNMRTLWAMDPEKQYDIAKETIEIYGPLAQRLGIGTIRGELEDLAFSYLDPENYKKLFNYIKHEASDREKQVRRATQILHKMLMKHGIEAEINARAKHLYSLDQKLKRNDNDITKIYDLVACRIIVDNVEQCYQALGIIHERWKPFEGRVKDYIASPKPNGYQSIHTTVKALADRPIEIQIRTKAMHEQAEYGIAAHWHYSQEKGTLNYLRRQVTNANKADLSWVNEIAKWQRQASHYRDFDTLMKIDFFGDRIFAYTPKGEIIDLPKGATSIDFAYAIHSEVGNHLAGAKVNGKMIRLQDPLKTGDTVELMITKKAEPKDDWLNECKTATARGHIRHYLKNNRIQIQGNIKGR